MLHGRCDGPDHAHGNDCIEIFRAPIIFARHGHTRISLARLRIAAHGTPGIQQRLHQRLQMRCGTGRIDQQCFSRATHAGAAHFCIDDYFFCHIQISAGMHIDMANAFEMRKHRHTRLILHTRDKAFSATRHNHVDRAVQAAQHVAHRLTVARRHKLNGSLRQAGFFQHRRPWPLQFPWRCGNCPTPPAR